MTYILQNFTKIDIFLEPFLLFLQNWLKFTFRIISRVDYILVTLTSSFKPTHEIHGIFFLETRDFLNKWMDIHHTCMDVSLRQF